MLILRRRGQEQRLQSRVDGRVDPRQLPLHVPVRRVAHAAHDGVRAPLRGVIRQQAGPQLRLNVGQLCHRRPHQKQLLLRGEHLIFLRRVGADADPDPVEAGRRPPDDIQMSQRDGVKAAGADCCSHVADPSFSNSPARR